MPERIEHALVGKHAIGDCELLAELGQCVRHVVFSFFQGEVS
jgi:hypothetical protein